MRTLVTSSLSLMHGWLLTDDNLITILRGLLFSPFASERKSFVRKVPIPKTTESQWLLRPKTKRQEERTFGKPKFITLPFNSNTLVNSQGVWIHKSLGFMVNTNWLIHGLNARSKKERISRVLTKTGPSTSPFSFNHKLLYIPVNSKIVNKIFIDNYPQKTFRRECIC